MQITHCVLQKLPGVCVGKQETRRRYVGVDATKFRDGHHHHTLYVSISLSPSQTHSVSHLPPSQYCWGLTCCIHWASLTLLVVNSHLCTAFIAYSSWFSRYYTVLTLTIFYLQPFPLYLYSCLTIRQLSFSFCRFPVSIVLCLIPSLSHTTLRSSLHPLVRSPHSVPHWSRQ